MLPRVSLHSSSDGDRLYLCYFRFVLRTPAAREFRYKESKVERKKDEYALELVWYVHLFLSCDDVSESRPKTLEIKQSPVSAKG